MGFAIADGIFRASAKIDTLLEERWRRIAIVICYFSIVSTLVLGITLFGKFCKFANKCDIFSFYLSFNLNANLNDAKTDFNLTVIVFVVCLSQYSNVGCRWQSCSLRLCGKLFPILSIKSV